MVASLSKSIDGVAKGFFLATTRFFFADSTTVCGGVSRRTVAALAELLRLPTRRADERERGSDGDGVVGEALDLRSERLRVTIGVEALIVKL
jgi:hypothetical protein